MQQTGYGMVVTSDLPMEQAEKAIRESLAEEGFGILTEIDVAATLREKLGIERAPYRILGACNPSLANRGLEADDDLGLLLPCNVVVCVRDGQTVVAALDPHVMADVASTPEIDEVAREARQRLERALARLES